MKIGIQRIESHFPHRNITAKALAEQLNFQYDFIKEKLGISTLTIADENEYSSDLATKSVEKIFLKDESLRNKIKVVVVVTQTPDYQLPHTAALILQKLKLPKNIASFDVSLGCSGFVYGLSIIEGFMKQNCFEYGLLITVETYSKIIDPSDKNTKPLFSDCSSAILIGPNPALVTNKFTFGTSGEHHQLLILKKNKFLQMEGRGIFNFVATEVPSDVKNCLKINNLSKEDVDYFIFHQASKYLLQTLCERLEIPDKKMFCNIEKYGNTVSSTIPLALMDLGIDSLNINCRLLVSGFGVGLSWASTVLTRS